MGKYFHKRTKELLILSILGIPYFGLNQNYQFNRNYLEGIWQESKKMLFC